MVANVSMVVANKAFDPTAAVVPSQLFSIPLANDTTGNVSNAPGQAAAVVMDAPLGRNVNSFKVPVLRLDKAVLGLGLSA